MRVFDPTRLDFVFMCIDNAPNVDNAHTDTIVYHLDIDVF